MNFSKEQLEKEYKKAKLGELIFFIISMVGFGAAVALVIVALIIGGDKWYPYGYSAGIAMCLAFTFLIMRSMLFTAKIRMIQQAGQVQQVVMDELKKQENPAQHVEAFKAQTREQKLFEQYENLYKQGFITAEELEQKKKELLN